MNQWNGPNDVGASMLLPRVVNQRLENKYVIHRTYMETHPNAVVVVTILIYDCLVPVILSARQSSILDRCQKLAP